MFGAKIGRNVSISTCGIRDFDLVGMRRAKGEREKRGRREDGQESG